MHAPTLAGRAWPIMPRASARTASISHQSVRLVCHPLISRPRSLQHPIAWPADLLHPMRAALSIPISLRSGQARERMRGSVRGLARQAADHPCGTRQATSASCGKPGQVLVLPLVLLSTSSTLYAGEPPASSRPARWHRVSTRTSRDWEPGYARGAEGETRPPSFHGTSARHAWLPWRRLFVCLILFPHRAGRGQTPSLLSCQIDNGPSKSEHALPGCCPARRPRVLPWARRRRQPTSRDDLSEREMKERRLTPLYLDYAVSGGQCH